MIATVLFTTAIVSLFITYQATIAGVTFSVVFFALFTYSERRVARERQGEPEGLGQFRVYGDQELGSGALGVRPGNMLVAVRDRKNVYYLRNVVARTNTSNQDVVVVVPRVY